MLRNMYLQNKLECLKINYIFRQIKYSIVTLDHHQQQFVF